MRDARPDDAPRRSPRSGRPRVPYLVRSAARAAADLPRGRRARPAPLGRPLDDDVVAAPPPRAAPVTTASVTSRVEVHPDFGSRGVGHRAAARRPSPPSPTPASCPRSAPTTRSRWRSRSATASCPTASTGSPASTRAPCRPPAGHRRGCARSRSTRWPTSDARWRPTTSRRRRPERAQPASTPARRSWPTGGTAPTTPPSCPGRCSTRPARPRCVAAFTSVQVDRAAAAGPGAR